MGEGIFVMIIRFVVEIIEGVGFVVFIVRVFVVLIGDIVVLLVFVV